MAHQLKIYRFMTFLSSERCPVCETSHVAQLLQNCEYDAETWFECQMCEHVFVIPADDAASQNSDDCLEMFRLRAAGERAILGSL